jgi:hypothetical protein
MGFAPRPGREQAVDLGQHVRVLLGDADVLALVLLPGPDQERLLVAVGRRAVGEESPLHPAGPRTGRFVAWMAPTSRAELVSETMTHWAATVCIQLPTLEVRLASHQLRNAA